MYFLDVRPTHPHFTPKAQHPTCSLIAGTAHHDKGSWAFLQELARGPDSGSLALKMVTREAASLATRLLLLGLCVQALALPTLEQLFNPVEF